MNLKFLDFKLLGDERGSMIAIEGERSIPFPIKRIYYIYGVPAGSSRGLHAHIKLKQVLICLKGSCKIIVDDTRERETVVLNRPDTGLLIDSLIWREMYDFSPDCVLLVLASEHYDASDYIRNYEDFLSFVQTTEGDTFMTSQKLILIGAGETAELCYEYFKHDSNYSVQAFSVEKEYIKEPVLFGLPVVAFEDLQKIYPPGEYQAFVAISYVGLNQLRSRLYYETKAKGYNLVSYISSQACIANNCSIGDNCLIHAGCTIQPFAALGNNVVVGNGSSIGHYAVIRDNCFLSLHVVILGWAEIGEYCFLGGNSTVLDHKKIGPKCIIGAGCQVQENLPGHVLLRVKACETVPLDPERAMHFG
ncbi:MAG: WxcM-like domain-containing protein [Syntrophomonas sp.]